MSDWDDNEYSLDENSWASSDGFSEWEGDSDLNEGDAADAWLAAQDESFIDEKAEQAPDYGYGGSTAGNLQLERFGQMGEGVKQAVQQILTGEQAFGKSRLEIAAIKESFGQTIGGDPAAWARQLDIQAGSDITRINPRTGKQSTIRAGAGTRDANMAIAMLSQSADEFLERGPGGSLVGNYGIDGQRSERQAEQLSSANEGLEKATRIFNKYADLYIHDSTKENNPELYAMRKGFVSEQLMKRSMEGVFGDTSSAIVPLPNELGVKGLKPTLSGRGHMGTPFNRVEFKAEAAIRGWTEEDDAYWQHMPSAKRSLFKLPVGATDEQKDWQAKQYQTMISDLHEARQIIRGETPTTRDETARQIRMSGFDRPYDEQAKIADLRNEAAIQGLDWQQEETSTPRSEKLRFALTDTQKELVPREILSMSKVRGSDRSTAHRTGEEGLSEVDYFVEQNLEAEEVKPEVEGIPQRTPEWYAARKKIITASTLIDSAGRSQTPEQMAVDLAKRREGLDDEFIGDAYTQAGVEGEETALKAFLAKKKMEGDELTHTDVGLIINKDMPGMGVSPDGRLSRDGENAGLLELKYLTTGSMKKDPVKKYYRQMQMQMLVTGETETNFFALDQYTGESIHEVVKADPKYQSKLQSDINKAQEIAAGLTTAKEINAMAVQTAKQRRSGTPAGTGQKQSFKLEADTPMGPYRPDGQGSGQVAPGIMMSDAHKQEQVTTAQMNADAMEDSTEATDEATKATRDFSKSLSEGASKVSGFLNALGKVAGVALDANDTAMDSVRFAAETGMDVKTARGLEFGLQESGGLTLAGARSVMGSTAKTIQTYGDVTKVGQAYTELATRGAGQGIAIPSLEEMRGFDGQGFIAHVQGQINDASSATDKMRIARLYGMPELAASNMTPAEVMAAEGTINEDGQREFYDGRKTVEHGVQTAKETVVGMSGYGGGVAAQGTQTAANALSMAGAVTAGAGGMGMLKTMKGAQTMGALGKGAKLMAKGGLLGAAAMAATEGVRYAGDIKDNGGTGDTVMDMLEFTAAGAGIGATLGSVVPGLGTAIGGTLGAGAGALVGAGNEVYEMLSNAVPNTDIDATGTPSQQVVGKTNVTNNIDVNVEVSKEMVHTEVDVDGDTYMDTEQGYGA